MKYTNCSILRFDNILSTNCYLKQNIDDFKSYTTIWADGQEAGRGRYNRKWISQKGKDLTFSILLPLEKKHIEYWKNITQIAALSICEEIEKFGIKSKIKWPNDLLINNKKICGILCEVIEHNSICYAVLGIGLNVNSNENDLSEIDQPATSLFIAKGEKIDREILINNIVESVTSSFNKLMINGFSSFKEKIQLRLAWQNEIRVIEDSGKVIQGKIIGISADGRLEFLKDNGERVNLISGEISFIK